MRNIPTKCALAIAIILIANPGQSHAGIVISNLDQSQDGSGTVAASGATSPQEYAQQFTTGSQGFTLGSIIVPLGPATGTFSGFAELVTDKGNTPGSTVLTTFNFPTVGATLTNLTFTANTSGLVLGANSSYWFILGATGTGSFKWEYTDSTTVSGGAYPNYANSHDQGTTWNVFAGAPFLMAVSSATAVPEPSSMALTGVAGIIGFGAMLRRRWRQVR